MQQTRTPRADRAGGPVEDVEGTLATNSRLRMWWLTTFRGYRVHSSSHAPKKSVFGRVTYVSHWWLKPPSNGN